MWWPHRSLQLFVRASCGNDLVLHANAWDKIIFLKTQIEQKTHVPPALQCLIHDCEPLNDHDTLDQCKLRHHSMLDMFPRLRAGMQIFVTTVSGMKITLAVSTTDTVSHVKAKIEAKHGIPTSVQSLVSDGTELQDDRLLSHYNVDTHSTLELCERPLDPSVLTTHSDSLAGITPRDISTRDNGVCTFTNQFADMCECMLFALLSHLW